MIVIKVYHGVIDNVAQLRLIDRLIVILTARTDWLGIVECLVMRVAQCSFKYTPLHNIMIAPPPLPP